MSDASIDLYRTRSATDVINVTFRFLRDQFGPLLKGLLLLAGPPLLLSSILGSYVGLGTPTMSGGVAVLVLLQFTCAIIGSIIVAAVSIGALDVYHREGREGLTVRRLWGLVRTHGIALFARQLQAGLVVVFGALLIGGLGAGVGYAVAQGGSSVLSVVVGALFVVALIVWLFYAYPRFALLMPGQVDPERPIFLRRCVHLVRGRWGQTLGVLLLALLISAIIFSVGWIPQLVLGVMKGAGMSPGAAAPVFAGIVAGVANILSSAITYTALTLQYYNLVETEEQVSLEAEVEQMEQDAAPASEASRSSAEGTADADTPPSDADADDAPRWRGDAPDSPSN